MLPRCLFYVSAYLLVSYNGMCAHLYSIKALMDGYIATANGSGLYEGHRASMACGKTDHAKILIIGSLALSTDPQQTISQSFCDSLSGPLARAKELECMTQSMGLTQQIKVPTHLYRLYYFTNCKYISHVGVIPLNTSNHTLVFLSKKKKR